MGKSAGKWMKSLIYRMKGLLFPKKSSSKPRKLSQATYQRVGNEEELWLASNSLEADNLALNPTSTEDLTLSIFQKDNGWLEDKQRAQDLPSEGALFLGPGIQLEDLQDRTGRQDGQIDPEIIRLESSAIKIQAALRGYLARRAFRALKGVMKIQALARRHLVRRQAVSTLYCMLGILKIQALAQGKKDKLVQPVGINTSAGKTKLSENAFVHKLLASAPNAMPLHLQYESGEANSVLNWLERWSASQFWKPVTHEIKEVPLANTPTAESETESLNLYVQKVPTENTDSFSTQSSDSEKAKRVMINFTVPSADFVQENPEHELEKVKRSLRKIHNPIVESTVQSETENEILRHSFRKNYSSTGHDGLELMSDRKRTHGPLVLKDASYILQDDQIESKMDPLWNIEEGGKVSENDEELEHEGDFNVNKETKRNGRRSWFQAKQGVVDNYQLRSRPVLPSYMAVTESAKAKLRAQSSPNLGQDVLDKHNLSRRHSANFKGGNRNDKPSLSSGNGNVKVSLAAEWRR